MVGGRRHTAFRAAAHLVGPTTRKPTRKFKGGKRDIVSECTAIQIILFIIKSRSPPTQPSPTDAVGLDIPAATVRDTDLQDMQHCIVPQYTSRTWYHQTVDNRQNISCRMCTFVMVHARPRYPYPCHTINAIRVCLLPPHCLTIPHSHSHSHTPHWAFLHFSPPFVPPSRHHHRYPSNIPHIQEFNDSCIYIHVEPHSHTLSDPHFSSSRQQCEYWSAYSPPLVI